MRRMLVGWFVALGFLSVWPATVVAQGAPAASGDFNGDGVADLAVGVPSEDTIFGFVRADAGAVNVLYGTRFGGLRAPGNQLLHQFFPPPHQSLGPDSVLEQNDQFGSELAAGDFNGDGRADLAVGAPREDMGTVANAGAVSVFYGTSAGLAVGQFWHQDSAGVPDVAETDDNFGSALAAGDFNGDGRADLAVGAERETVGGVDCLNAASQVVDCARAGAVNVLYGTPVAGLSGTDSQRWLQGREQGGDLADPDIDDYFGSALAAGDFNGDDRADLAVGAPGEDIGDAFDAGNVNVLYGGSSGLSNAGQQIWRQLDRRVPTGDPDPHGLSGDTQAGAYAEIDDLFGSALAADDFNGDGLADLAVGAPDENHAPGVSDAGAVHVLYSKPATPPPTPVEDADAGLSSIGNQFWHQDRPGVRDLSEVLDEFGSALAAGDFNGDGRADLAVGARWECIGPPSIFQVQVGCVAKAGAVNILYSRSSGLSAISDSFLHQDSFRVNDVAETDDMFGTALAAGDFGTGIAGSVGAADLAVGVPREDRGTVVEGGAVNALYGVGSVGLSGDGSQFWHQNSFGVIDDAEPGDQFGLAVASNAGSRCVTSTIFFC
jgi:FG-GAP repeat